MQCYIKNKNKIKQMFACIFIQVHSQAIWNYLFSFFEFYIKKSKFYSENGKTLTGHIEITTDITCVYYFVYDLLFFFLLSVLSCQEKGCVFSVWYPFTIKVYMDKLCISYYINSSSVNILVFIILEQFQIQEMPPIKMNSRSGQN